MQKLSLIHLVMAGKSFDAHAVNACLAAVVLRAQGYRIVVACTLSHAGALSGVVDLCWRTRRALKMAQHAANRRHLIEVFFLVISHLITTKAIDCFFRRIKHICLLLTEL